MQAEDNIQIWLIARAVAKHRDQVKSLAGKYIEQDYTRRQLAEAADCLDEAIGILQSAGK